MIPIENKLYRPVAMSIKPRAYGWYNLVATCHPSAIGRAFYNGKEWTNTSLDIKKSELVSGLLDGEYSFFWLSDEAK